MWFRIVIAWFVNERHTANENHHTCSEEKNKINLFRAAVFYSLSCTFAAFPGLFHHHNICVLRLGSFFFSALCWSFFFYFQEWWRAFRLRFIWKPGKSILIHRDIAHSLAHLFHVSNSINIHNLRSTIPSGRTGQLIHFLLSRFTFRNFQPT